MLSALCRVGDLTNTFELSRQLLGQVCLVDCLHGMLGRCASGVGQCSLLRGSPNKYQLQTIKCQAVILEVFRFATILTFEMEETLAS
jgi:hypothetical protein